MAAFIDSSILAFLTTTETDKQDKAMALLADRAVVSVQVLIDLIDLSRGSGLDWGRTGNFADVVATLGQVQPVTLDTTRLARQMGEKYSLTTHGALAVAAALEAGCDTIYSTDVKAAEPIEGKLTVIDPFKPARKAK